MIESIAIEIEEIIIEEKISINSMMEFFDNCISKTRILPIFIKISVINKDEKNIEKAKNIFNKLFAIYKEVKEKKYSLFSNKTNEFIISFNIMFNKLIITNVDFKKDNELCELKNELKEDISLTEYIIIPEKEKFNIIPDYFMVYRNDLDSLFNNQNYKNDFDNYNEYEINTTIQENKMEIEYSDIAYNEDKNDDNNESMIKNENQNEKKNSYIEEQVPSEIVKAFENYDKKIESKLIENNEKEKDIKKIEVSWKAIENENKIRKIEGQKFQEEKLDIKKEINRLIERIKKLDENNEFKYNKYTSREGDLIKLYNPSENNLYEKIDLSDNAPIKRILKTSEYLSNLIISQVSIMNLDNECPFKDLEINILIDCARTISDNDKFFTMWINNSI